MIMIQATEKNFDELLSMEKPLMVDFGAEWCGPCKALAPMVAELAEAYKEQAVIAACDVEENNDIAVRYSIRNIPTGIFFKDGGRTAGRSHCQIRAGGEIESVAVKKRECLPNRHSLFSLFLHFFKSYF